MSASQSSKGGPNLPVVVVSSGVEVIVACTLRGVGLET